MVQKSRRRKAKAADARSDGRDSSAQDSSRAAGEFPVVGIGASAGGLDACRKLVDALPADNGMAFILVQHLDPTHESMMVDLLVGHTSMTVQQAADGMAIERDHLYVIPPGTYLAVGDGALHLSKPHERHGARLPFDFLLHSLAEEFGTRAICVILSGTGADGSLGLKSVKEAGGLVIAQEPEDAGFDGMPRSAIKTGAVDLVLPAAEIPAAIVKYTRKVGRVRALNASAPRDKAPDWLPKIIDLLRTTTGHDFTLYKTGTLQRRIERRMAMAVNEANSMDQYIDLLQGDAGELELLAKDLLINVTSFFRDPKVFEYLAQKIIPDMVRNHTRDRPIRIWVAGCSSGEEAYSLVMLFQEQIDAADRDVRLQVFASDIDEDAVTSARQGFYPNTIEAEVSSERLARFFSKEDHGYRALPELRSAVVFTVHDVLTDPPFSNLDMVSCRNLLIYLQPEAQAKVIGLFHFALREDGLLLLGGAEAVGSTDERFSVISKQERLYQHVGRRRPGDVAFPTNTHDGVPLPVRLGQGQPPTRQTALADLCRRLVLDSYAPAAVLINRRHEVLYSLGPIDRYMRLATGGPTHDLLDMAREGMRVRLSAAIKSALQENTRIVVPGGRLHRDGNPIWFNIAVQPASNKGEELLLICFIEESEFDRRRSRSTTPGDAPLIAELEQELTATKAELQGAIRDLQISSEEQREINEEALSVNEEYQSANEELLTSKEELQSLNEELTALNGQLQETLERQRTTSSDLQNILNSTNVGMIFLDTKLNIRFFTPATKLIFNVISSDVGRPLADLRSLAADSALLADARTVLRTEVSMECETETQSGAWYIRRILPYRTQDNEVEGVVITYTDITERKHVAEALEVARRQAELANVAKSRFLAAASHDLRQPLQTLVLLQALLAKIVDGAKAQALVAQLDETVGAMSGLLNAMLDINQIEAGTVRPQIVSFPINDLLARMRDEFIYHAQAKRLSLHVVPCSLVVRSDPRLLEQMIRNLLSNSLKFSNRGKILLGCRRHEGTLSIEVWDTGDGIPESDLQSIFEEYRQLDNASRRQSGRGGLGLGLSIVQRLGNLLGHKIHVRSKPEKGSCFSIEVQRSGGAPTLSPHLPDSNVGSVAAVRGKGGILVIEDDPELRGLLELVLNDAGYHTVSAPDGVTALKLVANGQVKPDLILADYNLPNGMDGLQLTAKLRETLHREIPATIITGDISTGTLRDIALQNCALLNKPVKLPELTQVIQRLLSISPAAAHPDAPRKGEDDINLEAPVIYVIDDDSYVREGIRDVLEAEGRTVEDYATCEEFLEAYEPGAEACLVIDAYLPGMSGLELLKRLRDSGRSAPGHHDHGQRRCADGRSGHEGRRVGLHREADRPRRTACQRRARCSNCRGIRTRCLPGARLRQSASPASRRDSARSWTWFSPATPARISPRISASASARSRIIAPRS